MAFSKAVEAASAPAAHIQRILFARPDHLGDVVLSLPVFAAVKQLFPSSQLSVWVQPTYAGLLKGNPHVDEIITHNHFLLDVPPTRHRLIDDLKFLAKTRGFYPRFDVTICPRYDFEIASLLAYTGAPCRVGYQVANRWLLPGRQSLTVTLRKLTDPVHQVYRNLYLLTALKSDFDYITFPCRFDLPADPPNIPAQLAAHGLFKQSYAVLHTQSRASAKRWPEESFVSLIQMMKASRPDLKIVLTGSADELAQLQQLAVRCDSPTVIIAGHEDWNFICALLRHSTLVVSNDTGIMHLASVLRVATVDIHAGTNDPRIWGPWGESSVLLFRPTPCTQCHLTICDRHHECMTGISPDQVMASCKDLWRSQVMVTP